RTVLNAGGFQPLLCFFYPYVTCFAVIIMFYFTSSLSHSVHHWLQVSKHSLDSDFNKIPYAFHHAIIVQSKYRNVSLQVSILPNKCRNALLQVIIVLSKCRNVLLQVSILLSKCRTFLHQGFQLL